ncbi:MAG: transglycosylase SLT domain-containing protein [Gammaproteobacteria bacterium]|nr:transglycosylase SLT domain-containing protein [Gammaproteobacteria bacterium]
MHSAEIGGVWTTASKIAGTSEHVLYAIALQESKRTVNDFVMPWPWTVVANGISQKFQKRFFETKEDAYVALRSWIDQGVENIDVGIMQVNYRYHGSRFESLIDMLDPAKNIIVASKIFAENKVGVSEEQAIGRYHTWRKNGRQEKYKQGVLLLSNYLAQMEVVDR